MAPLPGDHGEQACHVVKGALEKPSPSAAALASTGVNLVNLASCHPSAAYLKPPSASKFRQMRSSAYLRHIFALDSVQNCAVEQVFTST